MNAPLSLRAPAVVPFRARWYADAPDDVTFAPIAFGRWFPGADLRACNCLRTDARTDHHDARCSALPPLHGPALPPPKRVVLPWEENMPTLADRLDDDATDRFESEEREYDDAAEYEADRYGDRVMGGAR